MMKNEVLTISADECFISADAPHRFSGFMSDLGLRVGNVPESLRITGIGGNGLPFVLVTFNENVFIYEQANGCIVLKLFND